MPANQIEEITTKQPDKMPSWLEQLLHDLARSCDDMENKDRFEQSTYDLIERVQRSDTAEMLFETLRSDFLRRRLSTGHLSIKKVASGDEIYFFGKPGFDEGLIKKAEKMQPIPEYHPFWAVEDAAKYAAKKVQNAIVDCFNSSGPNYLSICRVAEKEIKKQAFEEARADLLAALTSACIFA